MVLILGMDLGTSYLKAGLFDPNGQLCGLGRVRVQVDGAAEGRCEWPVARFWATFRAALSDALKQAGALSADIRAMACASQANSFLLADDGGGRLPRTPLVLWPDTRGGPPAAEVQALWRRPDFVEQSGLGVGLTPEFAVAKWAWWRRAAPAEWAGTRVFTLPDYVAHTLTGQAAVDAGTASLLGLLRQRDVRWWPEALTTLGIEASRLPTPLRPGVPIGTVTPEGAHVSGLQVGTRLVAGSLDHQLAAFGAGLGESAADLSVSLGTVLAVVGGDSTCQPGPGLCCLPGRIPSEHTRLAFDGRGGGLLEAYRANHAPTMAWSELDARAAAVPADADGMKLVWPPEAAVDAGPTFRNRRAGHGHGHAVRAILNASAEALAALVARVRPAQRPRQIVATGGGAASRLWLDALSARLDCRVVPAACGEPACRGAALLAAAGLR